MIKNALMTVGLACFSLAAVAQSIGTISNVSGTVTVNDGTRVVNATAGSPISNGARIVTTSTSTATVRLANGCVVDLKPGQAVTLLSSTSCSDLLATVQNTAPAGTPAPSGNAGVGDFVIGATGVVVFVAAVDGLRNRRVSRS